MPPNGYKDCGPSSSRLSKATGITSVKRQAASHSGPTAFKGAKRVLLCRMLPAWSAFPVDPKKGIVDIARPDRR